MNASRFVPAARFGRKRSRKCPTQARLTTRVLAIEPLETRVLLSASLPAGWHATPIAVPYALGGSRYSGSSTPDQSSSPSGLAPNQVRGAYGLGTYSGGNLSNGITFQGGLPGDGRGQTIAIVDAYDDPTALSDLNTFSSYYGLPTFGGAGSPTFRQLNQTGGTTLPGTDPSAARQRLGGGRVAGHRGGPHDGADGQHHPLRGRRRQR